MIEMTPEQSEALQASSLPLELVDPTTRETFVVLRKNEYERLVEEEEYDDSPWTDEEMDMLAAEDADSLGWDGMEAYQDDDK